MRQKNIFVIGSGFAGLAAACRLAKAGFAVTVLEKNSSPGGRAGSFSAAGFTFDMGPSWYWMPDVFAQFFAEFGKSPSDYYDLVRLDPSYRVIFEENEIVDVPAGATAVADLFEKIEPGSRPKFEKFLAEAAFKYRFGMGEFVQKPADSPLEFLDFRIAKAALRLQLFTSLASEVRSLFRDVRLRRLLEFPVLFLGATPERTPALYSLMNFADIELGTWYPLGGMVKVVEGMVALAKSLGVRFKFDCEVMKIEVEQGRATNLFCQNGQQFRADAVVAAADYHHVEQKLLAPEHRQYSEAYWQSRTLAPSSLLFYLGVRGRVRGLRHHNLFFDRDFGQHAREIYSAPAWPSDPLFYVCAPSVTDASVAPPDGENLFVLMPIAPDLPDSAAVREQFFQQLLARVEAATGSTIRERIVFKRSFSGPDFERAYHAFRGNAYGLANTLCQTAFLKPKMRSRKVQNLFFAGQLTVPGPGVPPALISGQVAARELEKFLSKQP